MKFLVVSLCLIGATKSAPLSTGDISGCFSAKNISANNQILICNSDNLLSEDSVDKLKLYEVTLPDISDCTVKLLISVKNSSHNQSISQYSAIDFKCSDSANCCDTIFIFYSDETRKISVKANLQGNQIQECGIQDIAEKSNLAYKTEGASDIGAFSRLTAFLNDLISELEDPSAACVNYEIETTINSPATENVSALPLIITIVLGVVIILVIVVLIAIFIGVCLARRSRSSGKAGVFLFRNGHGESQETEALEAAVPESKSADEAAQVVEEAPKKEAEPTDVVDGPSSESAPAKNEDP